jgi:hypothetical protein
MADSADPAGGDVLAGGRDDEGQPRSADRRDAADDRGPWWARPGVRYTALVAAALVALLVVTQSGLLSAETPPDAAGGAGAGGRLVVLDDGHLAVAVGDDWSDGPSVPDGVDSATDLVGVVMPSGRSLLVGAAEGTLFHVDPAGDDDPTEIGRATRVVGATDSLGSVVVERAGGDVAEVDARTGRTVSTDPFPGFEPSQGWRAVGLLAVGTGRSLLARRRLGDGLELGLAATERAVEGGAQLPFAVVGAVPRLLGVSPDAVLGATQSCPGPHCRVLVVTITRDDARQRSVEPPAGWHFAAARAGRSAQGLLVLERIGGGPRALARAVAGGDSALLVGGSTGVDLATGLVDDLDGRTHLVVTGRGAAGEERRALLTWVPGSPSRLVPGRGPVPPEGTQLVCACG